MDLLDLFGTERKRRAVWADFAAELGGTYHRPTFFNRHERIIANVRGVSVMVHTEHGLTNKERTAATRAWSPFLFGVGPKLQVYRETTLTFLTSTLRRHDITLGDARFDAAFKLESETPAVTRRLWTGPTIERLLALPADTTCTCDGRIVQLFGRGVWASPAILRSVVALLADLATRDVFGVEALRAVPGAKFGRGLSPSIELDGPVRVVIGAEHPDGVLVTVARAAEQIAAGPLVLEVVDGKPADPERAVTLPQGAHVPLHAVGTGTLVIASPDLHFKWRDIELDPARLRAGADLLGAIAVGVQGLYR